MKQGTAALAAIALAASLAGCSGMMHPRMAADAGWTTLIDGTHGMENFHRVGEANWTAVDGAIQATAGGKDPAYLVTNRMYKDFTIRAEFWASDDANSGIFTRCQNPNVITDENCYEANIFDQRPDPTYATGALVKVAPMSSPQKAGGKWNTFEVTAQGDHYVLVFNGVKTVDTHTTKLAGPGPVALQWGKGTIKWRKVEIKAL